MSTGPFAQPLPTLTRPLNQPRRYVTAGDLTHRDGDTVPSGYATDLASVPRALHWLLPPDGPYEAAAIRHDRRCDALNAGAPLVSSVQTDLDFAHDLRALGMGPARTALMWLGVRLGALTNPARRPGSLSTLPAVLLLLLASCWLVIPTLLCQAAVTVLDLLEPACPAAGQEPTRRNPAGSGHDGATPVAA